MLVGIMVIIIGAAAGVGAVIPDRYQQKYLWTICVLTIAFGIVNVVIQEQGTAQLLGKIDRYGTVTNWQASEASLEVLAPDARRQAVYSLVIKVIPRDHALVKGLNLHPMPGHSSNEPAYIDDASARWLYSLMSDSTGTVDVLKEYQSGIYTYYYGGRYDAKDDLVRFKPDAQTYWPSLYPSLKDLEGKYIVARILAAGVERPILTQLRLYLGAPAGVQPIIFMLPQLKPDLSSPQGKRLVTSNDRYVAGLLRSGQFLPR